MGDICEHKMCWNELYLQNNSMQWKKKFDPKKTTEIARGRGVGEFSPHSHPFWGKGAKQGWGRIQPPFSPSVGEGCNEGGAKVGRGCTEGKGRISW